MINKFFIITYAKNNKQFKNYLKKSKNSVLISFEDILSSHNKYTLFDEKESELVLRTDVYAKINTSIKNMLMNKRTPCFFIYYYINRVDKDLIENLMAEVRRKIELANADSIKTDICFLSIEELTANEELCLKELEKKRDLKLLEKIITLKKS